MQNLIVFCHRYFEYILVLNSWNKSYSGIFKKKDYIFRIGFHVSAKLNNNNKSKQTFVSFIKTKITAWFFEYKRRRKNKIGKQAAAAQDFELRGVKNCPILCVRLKTMAVFRPEKKRGWPPKALAIVQEFHESTKETDCHIMMIVIV